MIGGLPLSLRVPLIAAGLRVLVGVVASQQVMATLGSVQEERLRELARLHVDGLTAALGPAVLRRDVWEVYDTLDRATAAMAGQRMVLSEARDAAERSHILRALERMGGQVAEAAKLLGVSCTTLWEKMQKLGL